MIDPDVQQLLKDRLGELDEIVSDSWDNGELLYTSQYSDWIDNLFEYLGELAPYDDAPMPPEKILDELMVLFNLYAKEFGIVEAALTAIARRRRVDPGFPITASLQEYMKNNGYL